MNTRKICILSTRIRHSRKQQETRAIIFYITSAYQIVNEILPLSQYWGEGDHLPYPVKRRDLCVSVRRSAVRCVAIRCVAMRCVAVRCDAVRYDAVRCYVAAHIYLCNYLNTCCGETNLKHLGRQSFKFQMLCCMSSGYINIFKRVKCDNDKHITAYIYYIG